MTTVQASQINPADAAKLKEYLIKSVQRELELNKPESRDYRQTVESLLDRAYAGTKLQLPAPDRQQIIHEILNDMTGYGPIQPLLDDPEITEVMVNGPSRVYVERSGRIERTEVRFRDDNHVLRVIERIVAPLGRRIDAESPTVDARLPDGSRVNAVVPPVAIDGPSITIRKFAVDRLGIQQLIDFGSVSETMAEFLEACVKAKLNILISGGTGSGKTTLLNVLSSFIPENERIVTIEDAAELQLQQDHIVRMEAKAPNVDGQGEVSIRALVRNSLRMRPDRIVVGEVRGGEALDMLQAMNTGHEGSLTTVHANSPRDALSRLETLVLMAGMELPVRVVREQVASAIDVIVQQSRFSDGSRKVTYVTEVAGMEGDTIVMTDIFRYEQTGLSEEGKVVGEMKPTGIRPLFMRRLEAAGSQLSPKIFVAGADELKLGDSPKKR